MRESKSIVEGSDLILGKLKFSRFKIMMKKFSRFESFYGKEFYQSVMSIPALPLSRRQAGRK